MRTAVILAVDRWLPRLNRSYACRRLQARRATSNCGRQSDPAFAAGLLYPRIS